MVNLIKFVIVMFIVMQAQVVAAEPSNMTDIKKLDSLSWIDVSKQEYLENRLACELKIQEYKWSKNKWPQENPSPKPSFGEVKNRALVMQQIKDNLKMEKVLSSTFNIEISVDMLNHDLKRMVNQSQDIEGLKHLFSLLNNNPRTIVECISRPYLVSQKVTHNYAWYQPIHQTLKTQAENQLEDYRHYGDINGISFNDVVYQLANVSQNKDQRVNHGGFITLSQVDFQAQRQRLNQAQLQEVPTGFIYHEVIEESEYQLKVRHLYWKKQSLHSWLKQQHVQIEAPEINQTLNMPAIPDRKTSYYADKNMSPDSWREDQFIGTRSSHSAVWTGSEMIVWGGINSDLNRLNTGGRYNPITDSWQSMSIDMTPQARGGHKAIWTGTEMIIWGGSNVVGLNSGGRYNPVSDTWQDMSQVNAPEARTNASCIWTGSEMIIWGGVNGGSYLNNGARYNPSNDMWVTTTTLNAPSVRSNHSAVWTGDSMIIWGGFEYNSGVITLNTGGIYSPNNDSWTTTVHGIGPRLNHTAVWADELGEMIVWGGSNDTQVLNSGGIYNPMTNTWRSMSSDPAHDSRRSHAAFWTGDGMLVWGGYDDSNRLVSGGLYDPMTNSWTLTSMAGAPATRDFSTQIWADTEMIVWGGRIGNYFIPQGGRYNPVSDTWSVTALTTPSERVGHKIVWTGNDMIVWGGFSDGVVIDTGGRYNPMTDTWTPTNMSNAPAAREDFTAVWTGSDMLVWGGYDGDNGGTYFNDGGHYDPITDSWTAIQGFSPDARRSHQAVWSGEEMIVWGGYDESTIFNSGGRYHPDLGIWSSTNMNSAPAPRFLHSTIWTGEEMLIWGGTNTQTDLADGARYDPDSDTWALINPTGAPSKREVHTAVWTDEEMIIWGGYNGTDFLRTGGRYNPVTDTWTETEPLAPQARNWHTAVWTGDAMIIWGGNNGNVMSSGGIYDPVTNTWLPTQMTGAPESRWLHPAIWTGQEMIIFGGSNGTNLLNSMGVYYPPLMAIDLIFKDGFDGP